MKRILLVVGCLTIFIGKGHAQYYNEEPCNLTPITEFTWTEGFEDATNCWNTCDEDDDNGTAGDICDWFQFVLPDGASDEDRKMVHSGSSSVISLSYDEDMGQALDPSNWLISPAISLPCRVQTAALHFWTRCLGAGGGDNLTVYISTTGNRMEDFTRVAQSIRFNEGSWRTYDIDLVEYAGQTIHIAFRHHDCSGNFGVAIDDISIDVTGAVNSDTITIDTAHCSPLIWAGAEFTHDTSIRQVLQGGSCDTVQNINITVFPQYSMIDTVYLQGVSAFSLNNINADYNTNDWWISSNSEQTHGCDSSFAVRLIELSASPIAITSCSGSVSIRGNTYTTDTTFVDTASHSNAIGVLFYDTLTAYSLTILAPGSTTDSNVSGSSFTYNGQTYYRDMTLATTENQCDSIHFIVLNPVSNDTAYISDSICIPNPTISQHTDTLVTPMGGYDSITFVHHTYLPAHDTTYVVTAIENYVWRGTNYTVSNIYSDTLTNIYGCDSVLHLDLTINLRPAAGGDTVEMNNSRLQGCDSVVYNGVAYYYTINVYDTTAHGANDTIYCQPIIVNYSVQHHDTAIALSPYAYHNNSYTLSGDYTVPSPNCDTTFHLHLNIVTALPCDTSYGPTQQPRGCDAVVWDGQTYTQETRFFDTLVNSVGCDSIRHVHVFVYRSFKDSTFVQPDTNQASYTWAHNQQQYSANGIYYDSLHTVNGQCDSIYVLRLHWLVANCEPTYSERDTAVCGSMVWKGRRYTSSALLIDTLRNLDGCDSIATIRLTIKEQWQQLTDTSACDFLWYNGTTYTQSIDSITTLGRLANGCDSSRRLHITIRHSTTYNDTFTACERFRWENTVFSQTQDYVGNPRTNSQGCDSNIRLRIIILTGATTDTTAIACDSMTWHGTTYYDNGDYTFTTTGGNNCDSTVVLHLTIVNSQHDEITATSCDRYMWYEQSYTQSGNYTSVLAPTEDGCNHTVTLHLTILRSTTVRIDTSVCDYLAWHANYFRTDTVASFTTTNRAHCDSTEYLTLHIRHSSTSQRNVTACDSYTWHDSLFHHTTDYTHHATNHVGCDSAITLHLTIVHSDTVDTTIHACNRYTWHDSTYRSSTTDTFSVNDGNCHGAEIIHLVMGHSTTQRLQENRCDSLRWNDSTYTVSTTTQHTFTNVQGCDSTVTLQLYLRYSTHSYVSASECYSYTWHGITYYETTDTAKFVRTNTQGCDSVVHLRLTIRPSVEVDDTIKACERYVYNNRTYTSEAILNVSHGYTIYGCDSTTTQLLVIGHNGQNYNEQATACNSYTWRDNMTYYADTVINKALTDDYGCENNYTLALTIHHDTIIHDTVQACNSYMWSGRLFTYSVTESLTGTTRHGCVQRNVLHLTIHKDKVRTIDTAVCEELRLDANTYTNSVENLRRSMGRTVHGCDSTLVLTLRIKGRRTDTNVVNCNTVVWDSTTYIASQDLIDTIPMDNGCDSIHTIHIIVTHPGTTVDIFQACDSLTWRNGITYYEDQLLIDTVHIAGGCDSIIYLSLKIDTNTHSEITATANQPYLWDNETYTASGDYTHTYEAANGCDSTITLHLTYTTMRNPEILSHDQRLVMLNHYPNGQNGGRIDYYAYQWYCNGTPIEGATSDSYSYSSGGNLNGCFYVEVAVDANRNGWLRSNLICLGTYGIDDVDTPDGRLSIYPNPVERGATATLELTDSPAGTQEGTILLYDHLGRLILTQPCHAGDNTIVAPTTAGNYLLQLHTIDGRTTTTKVVVR